MGGTFTQLRNSPGWGFGGIGGYAASNLMLLTDGTVLCQSERFKSWKRLVPDQTGSYQNGTWLDVPDMHDDRWYFASAVLADGRVVVAGGEHGTGVLGTPTNTPVNSGEIFDPVANTWTPIPLPTFLGPVSDAPTCLLADGRWLLGDTTGNGTAIFDPHTLSWTPAGTGGAKSVNSDEETWTLLQDGTVIAVNIHNSLQAEKYVPSQDRWVPAGATPVDLVDEATGEIGPAVLLPNGRVFCVGGSGATAIYIPPPTPTDPGNWIAGPQIIGPEPPNPYGALDAPACLLPDGHVLFVAGHSAGTVISSAGDPTYFEFDGSSITSLGIPFNAPLNYTARHRLLILPSGQVLIAWAHPDLWLFTSDGSPLIVAKPIISDLPPMAAPGSVFPISGKTFNGLSQAVSYGDDYQAATNYPIVRLERDTSAGLRVIYCRTFNHSTMGVATGDSIVTTQVAIPPTTPPGSYRFVVVANGVPSDPVPFTVVAANFQDNWRWCNKCQGLFFAGHPSHGVCPAGGAHDPSGSWDYLLVNNTPGAPGQPDWRWCRRCEGLFFAGNRTTGVCPAGGSHDFTGSGNYTLLGYSPIFPGQDQWRWCHKCQGMFYSGNPSQGVCPASGPHDHAFSGDYLLFHT